MFDCTDHEMAIRAFGLSKLHWIINQNQIVEQYREILGVRFGKIVITEVIAKSISSVEREIRKTLIRHMHLQGYRKVAKLPRMTPWLKELRAATSSNKKMSPAERQIAELEELEKLITNFSFTNVVACFEQVQAQGSGFNVPPPNINIKPIL